MRYRVEVAGRPDGLYGVWQGRAYQAERSSADGTLLLVAEADEEKPDDFDTEWNSRAAKVVPEQQVESTFTLQTHCLFDDEIFRIEPGPDPRTLTLHWNGQDEQRARQLGLVDLTATAHQDEITALWQERHEFPGATRPEPGTGDAEGLVREIARTVRADLPEGWERVAAQFRQVGDYAEIEIRAIGDGESVSIVAPPQLGQLFSELRAAMYQRDAGTWFRGTLTMEAPASFSFDYDTAGEPNWRQAPGERPTARAYDVELARYPRARDQVPDWLATKAGLPLGVQFRQARLPEQKLPPVPPEEVRAVLDYLYRAPVVLARPGRLPDQINPAGPADVPDAFHTDGGWIWPAAVPHYLRKYGIPPEPEFLERIRANAHRLPYVPPEVRAAAEADVLGRPRPAAPGLVEPDAVTLVDRGLEPPLGLRASEVLTVLERRLAEYGVPPTAFRIGERAEGVWSLVRTKESWEVTGPGDGDPAAFAHVEEAARFLLGSLLLYPGRSEEPQPVDWPIVPLRGEPPLNFFRAKRMVLLAPGATVLRFGNDAGNLVHAPTTRFPEASLAPEREAVRQLYRLVRGLPALTGVTLPWGPMPGGAVGYLLPKAIAQHVEAGALERVTP